MSNLDEQSKKALIEALEDEYKARATYRSVITRFGEIRPFINIVESEGRHISALLSLFDRYDLAPPIDDWRDRIEPPESIEKACADGVQAEIDNQEMYQRLLSVVKEPSIRDVFERLQDASQNRHLPAFKRCLARDKGEAGKQRRRRGRF